MNALQVAFVVFCGLVGLLVFAKIVQERRQSYMESLVFSTMLFIGAGLIAALVGVVMAVFFWLGEVGK